MATQSNKHFYIAGEMKTTKMKTTKLFKRPNTYVLVVSVFIIASIVTFINNTPSIKCRYKTHPFRHRMVIDLARNEAVQNNDSGMFHVVTNFVPFNKKEVRKNLLANGKPPTDKELQARMAEIFECLERNLNNTMIVYVHVLVFSEDDITYLRSLKLRNFHKMIFHKNDKWPTMLDQFMYASKYLQGKVVVICHQDNYIGEGWEKVNHAVLMRERLMYALTRHPSPSKCNGTTLSAHCGNGFPYIGSHDTFVFYVREPIDRQKLSELDVTPNVSGMENVLIWLFKTRFNYRILNPCKVLVVHHLHCITVRDTGRKRINGGGKSATVSFTDQLQ